MGAVGRRCRERRAGPGSRAGDAEAMGIPGAAFAASTDFPSTAPPRGGGLAFPGPEYGDPEPEESSIAARQR
jgi:hypothetical protein